MSLAQNFELQTLDPASFRQQTRNATLRIVAVFAVSAISLSALLVAWLGEPGGNNFRWNLTGVLLGLFFTSALVGGLFRKQQWMQASVYSWQLKRCLMRITNRMHALEAAVAAGQPEALCVLRFYHQALYHMHQLEGNDSCQNDLVQNMNQHAELLEQQQLPLDQPCFKASWTDYLKQLPNPDKKAS